MTTDSKIRAQQKADEFYSQLRRLVRHYNPEVFGSVVAQLLYDVIDDIGKWAYYPPHHLLHAIEANCAYHRDYIRTKDLSDYYFKQILSHLKNYHDPYLDYALGEQQSLEYAVLAMARQQFPYQRGLQGAELARSVALFEKDDLLPKTATSFCDKYGFTIRDWIYLSFAVLVSVKSNDDPIITSSTFLDSEVESVPRQAVDPFLNVSSISPSQLAQRWDDVRREIPSHLHIFIPSVFLDYPLVRYTDGIFLVPHPHLLINHALEGLYRSCRRLKMDDFSSEFGKSFERYVKMVLGDKKGDPQIFREKDIQQVSQGKACDYIIVEDEFVILIECKAVRYSATLLTENAIKGDNSTTKLAEGLDQIYSLAGRISAGELLESFDHRGKRMLGITVTYGRIYFASSPSYIKEFISPKMKTYEQENWPNPLDTEPQIVPISEMERIIAVSNSLGVSIGRLIQMKLSNESHAVGEWDSFLSEEFRDQEIDWQLPYIRGLEEYFFQSYFKFAS